MKTKYLFYSLALAGTFAACTQDELIEAPVAENNVANRPVAGVVEFTLGDGVDSRFNYEKQNGFQAGDVFGLYLMDEYVGNYNGCGVDCPGEHPNANDPYWKYQNHWWGMYQLTNNIQSNYPFTATQDGDDLAWKNDAKLVEGNYFAMFPQNDLALNRRELWRVIDAEVELKAHSTKDAIFHNVENQFWLGYQQIYRDATASAEGVLKMNVKMSNVLVPLRFVLNNNSNNTVILDKISFVNKFGYELPTLAYVEPAGQNCQSENESSYPSWLEPSDAEDEFKCGDAYAWDFYDAAKTWTRATVQEIVRWSVPGAEGGRVPYGLTGELAKPAYEYSFTYPANEAVLAGGVDGGYVLTTYVVVPGMENTKDWQDLMVRIYGWYKDNSSATGWTYGLLTPKKSNDDDNYTFNLYQHIVADNEQAEETTYYRNVDVAFSEFAWKAVDKKMEIASTDEMEKKVMAYLSKIADGATAEISIAPDADGIEITEEFVKALRQDSKDNGHKIIITFSGDRQGKVIFNDNNVMAIMDETTESSAEPDDMLMFNYVHGIELINNAEQTIPAEYTVENAVIKNTSTGKLIVEGTIGEIKDQQRGAKGKVVNEGEMIVSGTINVEVDNDYKLTLNKGANLTDELNNNAGATTNVEAKDGKAFVNNLDNQGEYQCDTCVGATLNVLAGTLEVNTLENGDEDEVAATLEVAKDANLVVNGQLTNYSDIDDDVEKVIFNNNGTISGKGIIKNEGTINNYWVIDVQRIDNINGAIINNNTTDVEKAIYCQLNNSGVINAHNGKILKLQNITDGILYVHTKTVEVETTTNSNGEIIFLGVDPEHIGVDGTDKRSFRTTKAMETKELFPMMKRTATTQLYVGYDLTLTFAEGNEIASIITLIQVEGDKVNFTGTMGNEYEFAVADLDVLSGKQLHIENCITVSVEQLAKPFSGGQIHVGSNSKLENAEGEAITEHTSYAKN